MKKEFKPYPKYGDSGVDWLGPIPQEWTLRRISSAFRQTKRTGHPTEELLSVYRDHGVVPKDSRDDNFNKASEDLSTYQLVEVGDLVLNKMKTWQGSIAISQHRGIVSPAYFVAVPTAGLHSRFTHHLLRTPLYISQYQRASKGIRSNQWDLPYDSFKELPVMVPPDREATAIAAFLDAEAAKIDQAIKELEESVELANEEVTAMVLSGSSTHRQIRLSAATVEVSRPIPASGVKTYTKIGLYNRGRGLFHKDPSDADDMGDSDFFLIEEGDCIISGQFAWEGAVALADKEDDGCVVSHRYPVIRGREGVAHTEYIFALLCTAHGNFLLRENSRGAAGRNRPLNLASLLKEKVQVADKHTQERVVQAVHRRRKLLKEISQAKASLEEYRTSLIYEAVTGKIDFRAA